MPVATLYLRRTSKLPSGEHVTTIVNTSVLLPEVTPAMQREYEIQRRVEQQLRQQGIDGSQRYELEEGIRAKVEAEIAALGQGSGQVYALKVWIESTARWDLPGVPQPARYQAHLDGPEWACRKHTPLATSLKSAQAQAIEAHETECNRKQVDHE